MTGWRGPARARFSTSDIESESGGTGSRGGPASQAAGPQPESARPASPESRPSRVRTLAQGTDTFARCANGARLGSPATPPAVRRRRSGSGRVMATGRLGGQGEGPKARSDGAAGLPRSCAGPGRHRPPAGRAGEPRSGIDGPLVVTAFLGTAPRGGAGPTMPTIGRRWPLLRDGRRGCVGSLFQRRKPARRMLPGGEGSYAASHAAFPAGDRDPREGGTHGAAGSWRSGWLCRAKALPGRSGVVGALVV
jgi:hypothetical protein